VVLLKGARPWTRTIARAARGGAAVLSDTNKG